MRIGLINELHGRPGSDKTPSWSTIKERAQTAESVGFDIFVFEDALMYQNEDATDGVWESMTVAAALAATTERITFGQSVVNTPYRSPAITASMAETLNEISGGRYVLGLGAGNTADADYEAFGFPVDYRYSRFAEAIQIIHPLLKKGEVDFEGRFHSAKNAQLILRGPGGEGPKINIAAGGPKMIELAARFGDAWNWWVWGQRFDAAHDRLKDLLGALDESLINAERESAALERTLDYYSVVPEGFDAEVPGMTSPLTGSSEEIAAELLRYRDLGIAEVRCEVYPRTLDAIEAMRPVVQLLHAS